MLKLVQETTVPSSARTESMIEVTRDENIAPVASKNRRPPSAPRLHQSYEERILRSRPPSAGNSRAPPKFPPRRSEFNLPKPRSQSNILGSSNTSIQSTSPSTLTSRSFKFSKETRNHSSQTSEGCCSCQVDAKNSIQKMIEVLKKNEELEEKIKKMEENHNKDIEETDKRWKEKCVEIGNIMGDRIREEKKKYESKIKKLEKKIEEISIE